MSRKKKTEPEQTTEPVLPANPNARRFQFQMRNGAERSMHKCKPSHNRFSSNNGAKMRAEKNSRMERTGRRTTFRKSMMNKHQTAEEISWSMFQSSASLYSLCGSSPGKKT